MRSREELTEAMASVRDQVLAVVRDHENQCHDGVPCWLERCNVLAYMAHTLGMPVERLQLVEPLLLDYDLHCQDRQCSHAAPRQ